MPNEKIDRERCFQQLSSCPEAMCPATKDEEGNFHNHQAREGRKIKGNRNLWKRLIPFGCVEAADTSHLT
jgi:hypothetical protein